MADEILKGSSEWIALNKIWKSCSMEQRKLLETDFRLLTDFVRRNYSHHSNSGSDGYAYLSKLSPSAKGLVISLVDKGEPNLYHSIMAVIKNMDNKPKEDIMNYYYEHYSEKRQYVKTHWSLICEIFDLCWNKYQKKNR